MTSTKTNYIKVLFCPGYGQFSMEEPALAQTRATYILTFPYTNDTVNLAVKPFGAATTSTGPLSNPIKLSNVGAYGPVSDVFAVSDVDTVLPVTAHGPASPGIPATARRATPSTSTAT
jgi:hypothetical protein